MNIRSLLIAITALSAVTLFGCGGGGGAASPGGTNTTGTFQAGVLTISTASASPLPSGTTINGIDMTITLPAGVTVKADAATGAADPGVLALSGVAAALPNTIVGGRYDKNASTLHVIVTNVQPGFAIGEFMKVNFDGYPADTATFTVVLNQVIGGNDLKATPVTLTGVTATSVFAGV
jgi:hypothetical protein